MSATTPRAGETVAPRAGETAAAVGGRTDAATGEAVVFVGGCDRSGTTILSRLIAERVSLVVLPEAYYHAVAFRRHGADAAATDALAHWRRRSWGLPADDPRAADRPLGRYLAERMAALHDDRRGTTAPTRVVESTPENIEIASILLTWFPTAVVVHVVRDPRAVAASLRRADFGPTTLQECARFWKQRVASGLAAELRHPDRVVRIRYEDAVRHPAALDAVAALVAPDPAGHWIAARDLVLERTTRRLQSDVTAPIDARRVDAWRDELTEAEVGMVEYECRELMGALGYEPLGTADDRSGLARSLDSSVSILRELTVGNLRRGLRVAQALRDG